MNLRHLGPLLPCPNCRSVALLPADVQQTASISCPSCQSEFCLEDLLTAPQLSWKVVGELEPAELVTPDESEVSEDWREGELQLVASESLPDKPSQKVDWSSFQPANREQTERRKRRSRSAVWSVLQVVLGGLAAIPISLFLVWHLIGTDVADAGPFVGKYLPWIVPERFRPYPTADLARDDFATSGPRRGGLPTIEIVEPSGAAEETDWLDNSPAPNVELTGEPTSQPNASTTTPEADTVPDTVPDTAAADPLAENAFALIRQAEQQLVEWTEATQRDSSNLKSLAQSTYGNLIKVAQAIDKMPPEQALSRTVREALRSVGRQVKTSSVVRHLIDQGAGFWFSSQTTSPPDSPETNVHPSFGLAAIITVAAVEQSGDTWTVRAEDGTPWLGQRKLTIQIARDVAVAVDVGQKLFLLGTVEPDSEQAAPHAERFVASYAYEL